MLRTNVRSGGSILPNKKAFTLIELLAVIVILAIIALIAIPIVIKIIDTTKESATVRSAELYMSTAELSIANANLKTEIENTTCTVLSDGNLSCEGVTELVEAKIQGEKPISGRIVFVKGKIVAPGTWIRMLNGFVYVYKDNRIVKLDKSEENNYILSSLPAGLYDENYGVIKSWDKLIEEGYITITDNVITASSPDLKNIKGSLVIAEGVTKINQWIFSGYTKLINVKFPNTLQIIAWYAFSGCTGLTSVTIPSSMTKIDGYAFNNCSNISEIIVQSSNVTTTTASFGNCAESVSIIYEEGVTTINGMNCSNCTSITIPSTATKLGGFANPKLKELKMGGRNYIDGTNLTIPNTITTISWAAFENCTQFTSVTIPSSVTKIDGYAFNNCSNLSEIRVQSSNFTTTTASFGNCAESVSIIYEEGVTKINPISCPNCTSITIPSTAITLASGAFKGYTKLTEFKIGNHNYINGTILTIPNTITTISWAAFENCTGLTGIVIPNTVTIISDYAFKGCTGLISITIPNSINRIAKNAFENCTNLTTIEIDKAQDSISNSPWGATNATVQWLG